MAPNPLLQALELRDFAIVDALRLELSAGLNVLTGETGAGKSILIDALALLGGARADSALVRAGRESALVQGLFAPGTGLESASRRLQALGRSSARLDGELVTASELASRMGGLIAIHGQHASQVLLSASEQRKLLDRLLPPEAAEVLRRYRARYSRFQSVQRELAELREAARERARRRDILEFQLAELASAKLREGEEEALGTEAESLRHAERILGHAASALHLLSEAEPSALALVAGAARDLELAGRYQSTLAALGAELADALSSVQAVSSEVASFLGDFEADPRRLEAIEARLALLESLKRKYGESVPAMLAYRDQSQRDLAALEGDESKAEALEAEGAQLLADLRDDAAALSAARRNVAQSLAKRVTTELRPLGMSKAVFEVALGETELGPYGRDELNFRFSANLGEPPALLSEVASGGELSRLMLALNVVTGSDVPILAFDEVDAGIGGKTARSVGALLKRLAASHQVLVVTHLPQVAAFADAQFYVAKEEQEGRTVTRVRRLSPQERELELARMLSGTASEAALANARELLAEASV